MTRASARLVKGLEARGILDNTMILFLSDNGANAESGPDGPLERRPARRAELESVPRHELGLARQHALPAVQALHLRRRDCHAARRALAAGNSGDPPQRHRTSAGAPHRRDADGHRRDGREVSARVQGPTDSADGRRQPAPGLRRPSAHPNAADFLGARGQPRGALRQHGSSSRRIPAAGSSTTCPPIAPRRTIWRRAIRTSSGRSRPRGTRGPNGPMWTRGRGQPDCHGETMRRLRDALSLSSTVPRSRPPQPQNAG